MGFNLDDCILISRQQALGESLCCCLCGLLVFIVMSCVHAVSFGPVLTVSKWRCSTPANDTKSSHLRKQKRQGETAREREKRGQREERALHLLVHFPNDHSTMTQPELGPARARNQVQLSDTSRRDPSAWTTTHCISAHEEEVGSEVVLRGLEPPLQHGM